MPSRKAPELESYLREQAKELAGLVAKSKRDLSPRKVHRLRVATRRLRAVLSLAGSGPDARRAIKRLRATGRLLGRRRELDVAMEDARRYGIGTAPLKKARTEASKQVRRCVRPKLRKLVERAVGSVTGSRVPSGEVRKLAERVSRQAKRPLRGRQDFHALRIELKKARYALEALGKPVEPIKELQDLLGRAHDLAMLQTLLGPRKKVARDETAIYRRARLLAGPVLKCARQELLDV